MYSYKERIGYSKTDENLQLSNLSIVNFLQDAAIYEAQNQSISVERLYEDNLAWLLGSWQIQILKRPRLNDTVKITTSPYDFKGFLGYRNFTIESEAGEILVKAASIWSLVNTKELKPARVTDEIKEKYDISEKLDMDYKPRRINPSGEGIEKAPIRVQRFQIDSNHHMNNSAYVQTALEYLPEKTDVKEIRVEYKTPAYLDEDITPVIYKNENCMQVELKNKTQVCAIVEMSY